MDDVFIERLIARKSGTKEKLTKLLITIAVIIAIPLSFRFFRLFAPFVVLGILWGAWVLWTRTNIEYEYSLTNGELSIDVIYGQQKRKKLHEFDVREKLQVLAPVNNDFKDELEKKVTKTFDYCSSPDAKDRYFMNVNSESGPIRIFFEPDEKMLKAFRRAAPSHVKGIIL